MKKNTYLGLLICVVAVFLGCSEKTIGPGGAVELSEEANVLSSELVNSSSSISYEVIVDSAVAPFAESNSDILFNQDSLYEFEVEMADSFLVMMNQSPLDEEYFPANLKVGPYDLGTVGVRYKGAFGSLSPCLESDESFVVGGDYCKKLSMKIKFNKYQPELRFYGLKKVNIHAMMLDKSLLRDRVAYKLYQEMGVIGPRATHMNLKLNNDNWGVYIMVEQVDGRFTDKHFPENGDGNVYKEVWPQHLEETKYVEALKTNEDFGDVSGILSFANWLKTPKGDRVGSLEDWINLDNTLRYFAIEDVINNYDGPTGWYCWGSATCTPHNYYLFEEENQHKFYFVPWDLDVSLQVEDPFSLVPDWNKPALADCYLTEGGQQYPNGILTNNGKTLLPPICDPLMEALATEYSEEYKKIVGELLEGPFANVESWIDSWVAQIQNKVAMDTLSDNASIWMSRVEKLKTSVGALREIAKAKQKGEVLESFSLNSIGVNDFEGTSKFMLQAGMSLGVSEGSSLTVGVGEELVGLGSQSLKVDLVFRDNLEKWGQWASVKFRFKNLVSNLYDLKRIRIMVKSDQYRDVKWTLNSQRYSGGGSYRWEVELVEGVQELVLDINDLVWSSSSQLADDKQQILAEVSALVLHLSVNGLQESGFLGNNIEDVGAISIDDIILEY